MGVSRRYVIFLPLLQVEGWYFPLGLGLLLLVYLLSNCFLSYCRAEPVFGRAEGGFGIDGRIFDHRHSLDLDDVVHPLEGLAVHGNPLELDQVAGHGAGPRHLRVDLDRPASDEDLRGSGDLGSEATLTSRTGIVYMVVPSEVTTTITELDLLVLMGPDGSASRTAGGVSVRYHLEVRVQHKIGTSISADIFITRNGPVSDMGYCTNCQKEVEGITIPIMNGGMAGDTCLICLFGVHAPNEGVRAPFDTMLERLIQIEEKRMELQEEDAELARAHREKQMAAIEEGRERQERMIVVSEQLTQAQMANTRVVAEMAGFEMSDMIDDPDTIERRFEDLPDDDDDDGVVNVDMRPVQDMTVEDFKKAERQLLELVAARHPGTTADDWQINRLDDEPPTIQDPEGEMFKPMAEWDPENPGEEEDGSHESHAS